MCESYSLDEVLPLIKRAAHRDTVVIPILNGIGAGDRIDSSFRDVIILDGCVYIVAYIAAPGEIVQVGNIFKVVFGARENQEVKLAKLEEVRAALQSAGIQAVVSDNIKRDTFHKFAFISAFATCGVYYDITVKDLQQDGECRQMFVKLFQELQALATAMGIAFPEDMIDANLKVIDSLQPDTTASLQKDVQAGKKTEMDGLIFEVVRLAEKHSVSAPNYKMIAEKLGYVNGKL